MTNAELYGVIKRLRTEIQTIEEQMGTKLKQFKSELADLFSISNDLEDSFSHSWAGYHSQLYYGDFEKPPVKAMFNVDWGGLRGIPEGWQPRSYEDVVEFVSSKHHGTSLTDISAFVTDLREHAVKLKRELCTELLPISEVNGYQREADLLEHLDKMRMGIDANEYVKLHAPTQLVSRDTKALLQGRTTPPHVAYQARIAALLTTITAIEEFFDTSKRVLRQVEIRQNLGQDGETTVRGVQDVVRIFERFHDVARQLRQRHDNRSTLEVEDEYDVQDLLHGLLKLYFDDIRPEEWAPSYAGSASRIDFVLKSERIVVEVKKTRPGLTAKIVGEQLTLDAAKYQTHPDCGTLVCFVYDPEGKIANPRGLETDLAQLSTERLNVVVAVRPK